MSASSSLSFAAEKPVLLRDFAKSCCVCDHLFSPIQIQNIFGIEEHKNTVVDVAIKNVQESIFSGDERRRQSVELKFGDFIAYYTAKYTNTDHWLRSVSDLEFYLCQCPIFVRDRPSENGAIKKPSLPKLMQHFQVPDLLDREELSQINLWMAAAPSETSLHYDAYQNILVVLAGKKVVTLYPPSEFAKLRPYPIYSESSNHSQVDSQTTHNLRVSDTGKASRMVLNVEAGSAVYIPEGWWHQVKSDAFTIAINYWYNGLRQQLLDKPLSLAFYSRILAQELLKNECDDHISQLRLARSSSITDTEIILARIIEERSHASREALIIGLDPAIFHEVTLTLARHHASIWKDLLSRASDELVAVILQEWESNVMFDSDFYAAIFSPWESEDAKAIIQAELMQKRDYFRQKIWSLLARSLFG